MSLISRPFSDSRAVTRSTNFILIITWGNSHQNVKNGFKNSLTFQCFIKLSDEFGVPDSLLQEINRETTDSGQTLIPARLFTYVIGREIGTLGPSKHIACSNKGIRKTSVSNRYIAWTLLLIWLM